MPSGEDVGGVGSAVRTKSLYVIRSLSYSGTAIYTKGAIVPEAGQEVFYVFVSAKIAWAED